MLKIRLRRTGGSNAPAYRIVVSDSRRTPTATVLEELGYYDPTKNPPLLDIDREGERLDRQGRLGLGHGPEAPGPAEGLTGAVPWRRRTSSSSAGSRGRTVCAER
jgi:ribosomal protein S16